MYVLFYSKQCKYSTSFIKFLVDAKEDKFFKNVSIDKVNGKRPDFVKKYNIVEVPTIMIDNKLYAGNQAFVWLQRRIKNMKNAINSQATRVNKPKLNVISGFCPDSSSSILGQEESFDGNSSYCSLNYDNSISCPTEGTVVHKTDFILPNDSITGRTDIVREVKNDKSSVMESEYEKIKNARDNQDSMYKPRMI
jgi:hypothetical protein